MAPPDKVWLMASKIADLEELTRFENLFHRENLLLGLRMWIRTTALMIAANLAAALSGLFLLAPGLTMLALTGLSIFLFQWAAGREAARRYSFPVSPWCWWSINWRLIVYMLPVIFVLVLAGGPLDSDGDGRLTGAEMNQLALTQTVIAFLSAVPMGLATSQALLVSLRRFLSLGGRLPETGSRDEGDSARDSEANGGS